ncbi:hypothetical protein LI951_06840 [Enterococcus sp. BWT-B8]|uniref:hypothetical protein n=1 Tax=Enterococcus sp. BWT-B8 TaxID=2885157 RepID=UPI001E5FDC3E|nr:hypothetical protein [Enterococcus sp. BWT-B8]MCB5951776.1 hypothetical protein [Enterococcus sp. BWT-B8]
MILNRMVTIIVGLISGRVTLINCCILVAPSISAVTFVVRKQTGVAGFEPTTSISAVTFVVRKPQKAIKFFGFNFEQALEDMKIYFENIDKNKIAIILNESFNPFEKFIVDGLVNCGLFNSANIFCSSVSRLQKDIFSILKEKWRNHPKEVIQEINRSLLKNTFT